MVDAFNTRAARARGAWEPGGRRGRQGVVPEMPERGSGTDTALRAAERQEQADRLLRAVRELPLGQRQLVTLALEGLSYAEMAEVLDISSNLVGVRLNRARKALTDKLSGETDQ